MLNRITDAGIGSSGSDRLAVLSVLPFVSRRIGRRGIARSRAIQRSRTDERVLAAPLVQQAVATDGSLGRRGVGSQIEPHHGIAAGRCRDNTAVPRTRSCQGPGNIGIVVGLRIVTGRPDVPAPKQRPAAVGTGEDTDQRVAFGDVAPLVASRREIDVSLVIDFQRTVRDDAPLAAGFPQHLGRNRAESLSPVDGRCVLAIGVVSRGHGPVALDGGVELIDRTRLVCEVAIGRLAVLAQILALVDRHTTVVLVDALDGRSDRVPVVAHHIEVGRGVFPGVNPVRHLECLAALRIVARHLDESTVLRSVPASLLLLGQSGDDTPQVLRHIPYLRNARRRHGRRIGALSRHVHLGVIGEITGLGGRIETRRPAGNGLVLIARPIRHAFQTDLLQYERFRTHSQIDLAGERYLGDHAAKGDIRRSGRSGAFVDSRHGQAVAAAACRSLVGEVEHGGLERAERRGIERKRRKFVVGHVGHEVDLRRSGIVKRDAQLVILNFSGRMVFAQDQLAGRRRIVELQHPQPVQLAFLIAAQRGAARERLLRAGLQNESLVRAGRLSRHGDECSRARHARSGQPESHLDFPAADRTGRPGLLHRLLAAGGQKQGGGKEQRRFPESFHDLHCFRL